MRHNEIYHREPTTDGDNASFDWNTMKQGVNNTSKGVNKTIKEKNRIMCLSWREMKYNRSKNRKFDQIICTLRGNPVLTVAQSRWIYVEPLKVQVDCKGSCIIYIIGELKLKIMIKQKTMVHSKWFMPEAGPPPKKKWTLWTQKEDLLHLTPLNPTKIPFLLFFFVATIKANLLVDAV